MSISEVGKAGLFLVSGFWFLVVATTAVSVCKNQKPETVNQKPFRVGPVQAGRSIGGDRSEVFVSRERPL